MCVRRSPFFSWHRTAPSALRGYNSDLITWPHYIKSYGDYQSLWGLKRWLLYRSLRQDKSNRSFTKKRFIMGVSLVIQNQFFQKYLSFPCYCEAEGQDSIITWIARCDITWLLQDITCVVYAQQRLRPTETPTLFLGKIDFVGQPYSVSLPISVQNNKLDSLLVITAVERNIV